MAVFLPGYKWVTNARNGGGAYATNGPSSILLHMTVSMGVSESYIQRHPYPPHLWANPYNGDRFQTVTLDRSAFALYQPDYGNSWTNRKGYTLQTEIVGVPEVSVATYTDAQCRWIGEQVVAPQATWLASIGRPVNLNQVRYHPETGGSASDGWYGRMSEAEWDAFNGLDAHIDVPYNDHWDCSAERLDRIAAYARAAMGGYTEENELNDTEKKQLANIEAMLRNLDPVVRDTFNRSEWTWSMLPGTDKVVRDTYNNTGKIINDIATISATGETPPTLTVEDALHEASFDQLINELSKRRSAKGSDAADVA